MKKQTISLYVNSSPYQIEIGPQTTLLEVLRDELQSVRLGWPLVPPRTGYPSDRMAVDAAR